MLSLRKPAVQIEPGQCFAPNDLQFQWCQQCGTPRPLPPASSQAPIIDTSPLASSWQELDLALASSKYCRKHSALVQGFLSFLTRFSPPKNLDNVTPGMERQGFKDPSPQGQLQLLRLGRSPSTVLGVSSPPRLQDCRFIYWSDTSWTSRPFRSTCVLTLEPADA